MWKCTRDHKGIRTPCAECQFQLLVLITSDLKTMRRLPTTSVFSHHGIMGAKPAHLKEKTCSLHAYWLTIEWALRVFHAFLGFLKPNVRVLPFGHMLKRLMFHGKKPEHSENHGQNRFQKEKTSPPGTAIQRRRNS